jgi:hypothetical protein
MISNYSQLINLPALPMPYINEGLESDNFEFFDGPYVCAKPAKMFATTDFYKLLQDKFGSIMCRYLKNPPNSFYDWHIDKNRNCGINWVIKSNAHAKTFYRSENHHKLFWNIEEIKYTHAVPTLIDTSQQHCVFNNYHDDRIVMSLSIFNNHTYQSVLEYLTSLTIIKY